VSFIFLASLSNPSQYKLSFADLRELQKKLVKSFFELAPLASTMFAPTEVADLKSWFAIT
jgi:hypothetical protein